MGLALMTAVSTARFNATAPAPPAGAPTPDYLAAVAGATTSGWSWAFAVGAAILLIGAIVAFLTVRISKEDAAQAAVSGAAVAA